MFFVTLLLAIPFGKYIAKVYGHEKTFLDVIFDPIEKLFFRISGIDPLKGWNWKQNMVALMAINFVWFLLGMFILMNQNWLPLNPDNNPGMSADLAFNTTISFIVNCNLQHYSGESGLSYFGQLYLMFLQFVSAATGMAAVAHVFVAFKEKTTENLGNFFFFFTKSITKILIPIAVIVGTILLFNGSPMTFNGKDSITNLEGKNIEVSTGPVAAFVAIKHLGTNGGGFFGTNSAHPFENPNYISNFTEMVSQMIIPFALVFAFGYFIKRRKLSWTIFAVMSIGFLSLMAMNVAIENSGNPALQEMGANRRPGNMKGKENRFVCSASDYR